MNTDLTPQIPEFKISYIDYFKPNIPDQWDPVSAARAWHADELKRIQDLKNQQQKPADVAT